MTALPACVLSGGDLPASSRICPGQRVFVSSNGADPHKCLLEYIPMSFADTRRARGRRGIFLILAIVTLSATLATSAYGSPVTDKKKQAEQLAAQIEANGDKISALSESYNATQLKLSTLRSSITDAENQLNAAEQQNNEVKTRVAARAVTMYLDSSRNESSSAYTPVDEKRKRQYANIATGNDDSTIQQLTITQENVADRKAELEKQLTSISEQEQQLAQQKKELEAANSSQVALLNKTKGELATLVAQEQARKAQPASTTKTKKSSSSNQTLPTNLPAPSPKAAAAIEFARQQLGKPYRYAAVGPDTYDCSGLTMKAYAAAGISMPHYSGAQYAMFPKVPTSMLEPGDLVFRGPGGSQHVGIYIGNGLMINAPSTGDVVKVAPIGRIIGGARPTG